MPGRSQEETRSVRTPQQARSRRTRERIREAAVACFETHGYDATTTAMIAEKAGIAVGTLYAYFTDKRAVLLELVDDTATELSDYVVERLAPESWEGTDPREMVGQLIDAIFHTETLQPGMQRIMWERYFKDPDVQERIAALRDRNRAAVDRFLDALEARGMLRPLDRDIASLVVVNAVQWNAVLTFIENSDAERLAAARATSDLIGRYVFTDGAG